MEVFAPNELIRAVWAHPPQPSAAPVRTGVWHIVTGLLREGGILNSPEAPRSWRWSALIVALLYQSLWCLALVWLMYVRFWIIPWAPPEDGAYPGAAIEVTFIDPAPPPAAPTLPTPLPEPSPEPLPAPLPEPSAQRLPELSSPQPAPVADPDPAPASPLMVTEVDTPDEDAFTLHAPKLQRPEAVSLPPILRSAAEREVAITEVPLLQRPTLRPPSPDPPLAADISTPDLPLQQREIPAPLPSLELRQQHTAEIPLVDIPTRTREISEREIPAPLTEIELRPLSPSALPTPAIPARERTIAEREIALPPPAPPAQATTPSEIALPPPSEASTARNDAWELPTRQPGTGSGLVDEHGRPRLAGNGGARTGGGLPPGTIIEDHANIDRMGTWLKRPSPDYQPGQLDQLWVPHENILEEWVRRSIKNIWIPIPGTNKAIRCTVVLLMLGGSCGVTDPNLLDIEANSRPPPDIPFKPELHEDQDSLSSDLDPSPSDD